MSENNVNPVHDTDAARERQREDVYQDDERREAKRVPSEDRSGRHIDEVGISNRMTPDEEARNQAEHPPIDTSDPPPSDAAGRTGEEPPGDEFGRQTSLKAGSRAAAQKAADRRHVDEPAPPSRKVDGAFGRERETERPEGGTS